MSARVYDNPVLWKKKELLRKGYIYVVYGIYFMVFGSQGEDILI